jgi:GNAT superfamily N-acetyltransferase
MDKENAAVAISQVTEQNIDDFLGLISKLAEFENLPSPNAEAKTRLRNDCLAIDPKFQAYIAKLDDNPAGYIVYFFTYSTFLALPTLFLEDIFVLEEYRRQGVGKALFNFVIEAAKRDGCGRIEFNVLKWNTQAQAFYESNGAQRLEWFLYRIGKDNF